MNPGDEREPPRSGAAPAVLLEREAAAARLNVPRALRTLEPELQKASARIRACGLEDPFGEDRLRALPPRVVRAAMAECRKAGLLGEGPEWAARREQVPPMVEGLRKVFQRQLDLDRELPGLARGR